MQISKLSTFFGDSHFLGATHPIFPALIISKWYRLQ